MYESTKWCGTSRTHPAEKGLAGTDETSAWNGAYLKWRCSGVLRLCYPSSIGKMDLMSVWPSRREDQIEGDPPPKPRSM